MERVKETFEAQAEVVARLLDAHKDTLSLADRKHLGCAFRNLERLAELRRNVLRTAKNGEAGEHECDALAEQIVDLLHLPPNR